MNLPREQLISKLTNKCNRCQYNSDLRILKLRTPISRSGKGDSTYWSEATKLAEQNLEGFEVLCPNCIEIEKLNKKSKSIRTVSVELPAKADFSPYGYASRADWAKSHENQVFFEHEKQIYVYPEWSTPVCTLENFAAYYNVVPDRLLSADECVSLEKN